MPVGKPIDIKLNSGDGSIMSEKAVGADWKCGSTYIRVGNIAIGV